MTDTITVMFQEQGESRRVTDKPGAHKARIVWDDESRAFLSSVIAEACAHTVNKTIESLGVDAQTHSEQHKAMTVLIPWIEAQKRKAEKQAEFWETMLKENAKRAVSIGFWFIVASIAFGASGGWQIVKGLMHP